MALTDEQVLEAEARSRERIEKALVAREAYFDGRVLVLALSNGKRFEIDPHVVQGLENATDADLRDIQLSPLRDSVFIPALDADLSVEGLVAGRYGSKAWMKHHR
ncbi:DUF2442 domain-containing protein [Burkholderia arboris]|uniref:DUF2442 domain-containing protein n=1 Tax=Burkholderia cepacia complex TaxID=87882 RepID=UPI00158D8C12|nr:DUF2442 domain-containing protein [Burkholderia arboris]